MPKARKSPVSRNGFTLGRGNFGKISAVEGIYMDRKMLETFGQFDSQKLSAKKRRDALAGKFGTKR